MAMAEQLRSGLIEQVAARANRTRLLLGTLEWVAIAATSAFFVAAGCSYFNAKIPSSGRKMVASVMEMHTKLDTDEQPPTNWDRCLQDIAFQEYAKDSRDWSIPTLMIGGILSMLAAGFFNFAATVVVCQSSSLVLSDNIWGRINVKGTRTGRSVSK
jgi:hypothetical protein